MHAKHIRLDNSLCFRYSARAVLGKKKLLLLAGSNRGDNREKHFDLAKCTGFVLLHRDFNLTIKD